VPELIRNRSGRNPLAIPASGAAATARCLR
jgi:hypothetical protein